MKLRYTTLLAGAALAATQPAMAQNAALPAPDQRSVLHIVGENDSFGLRTSDRWYTSGARLGYTSPEAALPAPLAALDGALGRLLGPAQSRWGVALGQNIYTPQNLLRSTANPADRPYAGYLYLEGGLTRRTNSTLDSFNLQLGVVGPAAGAQGMQNAIHSLNGGRRAAGWRNQLRDEPTINLSWQRIWRLPLAQFGSSGVGIDALPALELAAGTVAAYAQAGARVRIGSGLGRDFGGARVRPGGGDAVAPVGDGLGWYVFGGASGRVVGRDVFLDGSTFRSNSASITKRNAVGDLELGAAAFWRNVRLSYTHDWRSNEFAGQRKPSTFGILALAVAF